MNQYKKGLRWRIFNLFGPPEVKNLIRFIDELTQDGSDIAIFPTGQFPLGVKTSNEDHVEPFIFSTEIERNSFQAGMNFGGGMMGGSTALLSKADYDEIERMEKLSTHSDRKTKLN